MSISVVEINTNDLEKSSSSKITQQPGVVVLAGIRTCEFVTQGLQFLLSSESFREFLLKSNMDALGVPG